MTLEDFSKAIEELRLKFTFECDESYGLTPMSEQSYLLALGALEQAQRFATIAHYQQLQKQ